MKYELVTQKVLDIEDDLTFVISNDKDIWMDQKTMAALLGTTQQNIAKHLNKKFESGELFKEENTKNPRNTTNSCIPLINPKSTKQPILYNFEAILVVAFSVNSKRAIEVRRWAKEVLATYVIDGVVIDKERAIEDEHVQNKLDQLVPELRSRGNDLMKVAQRIFSHAIDYDAKSLETRRVMANFTNLILKGVSGMTSGELMWYRSDANAPNAGMTTYKGKKGPTLADASVGTNFLTTEEHKKRCLTIDSVYATMLNFEADNYDYSMQDILDITIKQLKILKRPILEDHGTISYKQGREKSQEELRKWRNNPDKISLDINQTQLI